MKGVTDLRGFYIVTEFRLNHQLIPYDPSDTVRWQEATFEKWSTLTFKVNKPVQMDLSNGGGAPMRDINRTFELTGVAGGRRVFYYDADTVNVVLYLQDKNTAIHRRRRSVQTSRDTAQTNQDQIPASALAIIGNEDLKIDERA